MVEYARRPRCLTAVTSREMPAMSAMNRAAKMSCEDETWYLRSDLSTRCPSKLCALGNMMQGMIACLDARILSSGSQPALEKRKVIQISRL